MPVVALAMLLGWRSLPAHQPSGVERRRFDLPGTALFAASLGAVILIPTLLKLHLPIAAVAAGFGSVALGVAFVRRELATHAPVVDVRLFARPHFAAACASIGLSNLVMYTTLLALPLYLERVRGESVQMAGLVLAALSAFSAMWGPLGGRWTDRRGRWLPAVAGAVVLVAGTAVLAASVRTDALLPLVIALAVMGLGLGVAAAPVQTAAIEAVPAHTTGSAAGIYSTSRYLGSVVGSSLLALVFLRPPGTGETTPFLLLFAGLAAVAVAGVAANARVAVRGG